MTSSKIATAGSSLSKVVTITSLGRNVLQQYSEVHPKGSAAQERKDGVSFTWKGAQSEPPHIKEGYRNLNNQQAVNLDGLSTVMGVATRAPFSLRPDAADFKDPWTW